MDNRFKVGDKVLTRKDSHFYKAGEIFTIVKVDTIRPWSHLKYMGVKDGSSTGFWLYNDDIIAYTKKAEKTTKYHVGQKVRLKEPFGGYNPGDIAEIT